MEPIVKLNLHCQYQAHSELCQTCRNTLFDEGVIVHDSFAYGRGSIGRVAHFYDPISQTIRMKKIPGPATLIGDHYWGILPKTDLNLSENEASDTFHCESFLEKLEELYTGEITLQEMIDQTNFRNRGKRKPLF